MNATESPVVGPREWEVIGQLVADLDQAAAELGRVRPGMECFHLVPAVVRLNDIKARLDALAAWGVRDD